MSDRYCTVTRTVVLRAIPNHLVSVSVNMFVVLCTVIGTATIDPMVKNFNQLISSILLLVGITPFLSACDSL
jgi:hypothetical protein